MNKFIIMGRATQDPELRYSQAENSIAILRFGVAVNRFAKTDGADFFNCVVFGKSAESLGKYVAKGMKLLLSGHVQSGSYTNKDGQKVYTVDFVVDEWEFAEKKTTIVSSDGFMNIPDGIDEELPFPNKK